MCSTDIWKYGYIKTTVSTLINNFITSGKAKQFEFWKLKGDITAVDEEKLKQITEHFQFSSYLFQSESVVACAQVITVRVSRAFCLIYTLSWEWG